MPGDRQTRCRDTADDAPPGVRVRRPPALHVVEFGGNAPFLVFEDADVDAAVEGAAPARFVTAVRRVSRRTDFCCPTRSRPSSRPNWRASPRCGSVPGRNRGGHRSAGQCSAGRRGSSVGGRRDRAGAAVICGGHAPDGIGYYFEPKVVSKTLRTAGFCRSGRRVAASTARTGRRSSVRSPRRCARRDDGIPSVASAGGEQAGVALHHP